jgi:hypothetical protein
MRPRLLLAPLLLAAVACGPTATAIHDPDRSEHFFDVPWPDPARADAEGHPDLDGFPQALVPLTAGIVDGWARRLGTVARGFGNNTGAYFRFDGPLDLPATLDGAPGDPVVWIDLDTGALAPVDLRFVDDPRGDPFYGANTLAVVPRLGHAPRSGARVGVAVLASAGARAAEGVAPDPALVDALRDAGVRGRIASSTTFTVQDATGELRALAADAQARGPAGEVAPFVRVVRLSFSQALTASGEPTTRVVARYEGGGEGVSELAAIEGAEPFEVDLLDPSFPAIVYEGVVPTWNYQGLDDRPYMRPGIGHTQDVARDSGWIVLDGGVVPEPEPEPMRVVVAVPRAVAASGTVERVLLYDHGTGGHAYNFVQRRNPADDGRAFLGAYADAGVVVIGRDAPLYGTRFPLIDRGFAGGSLGFYNVVNLPAFRDNQRQAALDAVVLQAWLRAGAAGVPVDGLGGDGLTVLRQGHSLGSVTTALSLAAAPEPPAGAMLTGTGGVFSHYFLDTGLLDNSIAPETVALLYGLFGADVPEDVTPASALGAALGLPEPAWAHIDRQHPAMHLFQWTMDPSDPMAVAREIAVPARVVIAEGDWQTPDFTAEALAERLPDATVRWCPARGDYDPHHCMWREPEGPALITEWLSGE